MATVWPKNRGKKTLDAKLAERRAEQRLTLTCGIGGCRWRSSGPMWRVMERRAAHREKAHPDFVEPPRKHVRGFGGRGRVVAETPSGYVDVGPVGA